MSLVDIMMPFRALRSTSPVILSLLPRVIASYVYLMYVRVEMRFVLRMDMEVLRGRVLSGWGTKTGWLLPASVG